MKKISYILIGLFLGLGFTAYAATTVSLGKNGTSEYLLYPTDSLSAYRFIATSTTASSTFGNGIDIANGCFAIGSVCLNTGNIAESGNLYFTNPRVQTYLDTLSKGYFWSTTSADAWDGTKSRWATTSSDYWFSLKTTTNLPEGSNLYYTSDRATSSFTTLIGALDKGYFFSTTSADAWKLTKDFWSTTSAAYWYTLQNKASSTLFGDTNTWSNTNQFASLTFTNATGTRATTTELTVTNAPTFTALTGLLKGNGASKVTVALSGTDYAPATSGTSLQLANGSGGFSSYAGVTCTNQFLRALSGAGASTCATVANTDLANSAITINGTSVSLGGTITVASTTLLANNNTWSGANIFNNITRSTTTNGTTTSWAITSILSKLLKTGADGSVQGATLGTDYVNGSGTNGNCVAWGASNALTDAGAPCGSGSGGGASQWATSTLYSNAIHTAGAQVVGIGTSTPWGTLTISSTSPEMWFHNEGASANQGLAYISLVNGNFIFGTSSDQHVTNPLLQLSGATSTVYGQAFSVGNGTATSSIIAGTGTSTPNGGINLGAGGCYAVLGSCIGVMALNGTQGQVNYYSAGNTAVGTSSLFIATSQNVGVGSTSPWAKLSIDTNTTTGTYPLFAVASSSLSMFVILPNGNIGVDTTSAQHKLDVRGRIAGQPAFDCTALFMSQTNVTADQLGSATVASFACEGNMFVDVNTANAGILALSSANVEAPMASGTPAVQLLDASIATPSANNLVFLKTHVLGSATSSLGRGLAMQATIRTPKVSTATTSVTYVPLAFSDAAITSLTTTAAYALPSNGCALVASSTPNWKLQCRKASATVLVDTGFATSTTAFKALLTIDSTGANVYFNGSTVSSANIPAANLPVVWLRPTVGVGLTGGVTPGQAQLGIGNLQVWGQDKY